MRISDWSSDVCSSDLFADQISVGPSFDFRLNQDSSVRSTTSLPAGYFRTRASAPSSGQFTQACRSEEHTSELQSLMRISYAVFSLKKTIQIVKSLRLKQI